MKVSSPVGDFPFEPLRVTVKPRHLTLEGQVGAWPARVEFEPKDVVSLAKAAGAGGAVPPRAAVGPVAGAPPRVSRGWWPPGRTPRPADSGRLRAPRDR